MGLAGLGSLAGGLSSGLNEALNQAAKRRQFQEQQQAEGMAGQAILGGASLGQGGNSVMPQMPAPGQGSQPMQSGFGPAVAQTMKFEGGLNPSDTNGTPSNFGINQKANPGVDVKSLTPQAAQAIYKQKYWDPIGGDSLPPALQKIAFDTSVMAGPGVAKRMLQQSGGDPQKFMQLRQQFEQGLLQKDPAKYGGYAKAWANRDATLGGQGQQPTPTPSPQGGSGGVQSQGGGQLQQLAQQIKQQNPNATPAQVFRALSLAAPHFNKDEQQQLQQQRLQMQEQMLQLREALGEHTIQNQDRKTDQGDKRLDQGERKLDQGDQREQRMAEEHKQRLDLATQKAAQLKQQYEQARTKEQKNELYRQWRQAFEEKKAAQSAIDRGLTIENSANANPLLSDDDRKRITGTAKDQVDTGKADLAKAKGPLHEDAPPQSAAPAQGELKPPPTEGMQKAKVAIQAGVPREKVVERLRAAGYDTSGL